MRYIDADELVAALQPAKNAQWNKNDHSASRSEMIADFCTELENWRTADVVPRSWIKKIFDEIENKISDDINDITESINHITDPDAIDGQYKEIATLEWALNSIIEIEKKYIIE